MKRLYRWRQDYIETYPHLSAWIGFGKGLGIGLLIGYWVWG